MIGFYLSLTLSALSGTTGKSANAPEQLESRLSVDDKPGKTTSKMNV